MDHKNNFEFKVTYNKSLLLGPYSAKQHVSILLSPHLAEYTDLENTKSIIKLDIMYSSPPANFTSATIDQEFLTSKTD